MHKIELSMLVASGMPRRVGRVLIAAILIVALQAVSFGSASATTKVGWTGGFTGAYATNPTPVLNMATSVIFTVSRNLNDPSTHGAEIRIFEGSGTWLKTCNTLAVCSVSSNPAPGATKTYYAQLRVWRDGVWVNYATSPTVTVTDPGWNGEFTQAYATNPMPVLNMATSVIFEVDSVLNSAEIRIFEGSGTWLKTCNTLAVCSVSSNPAPGATKTYYAQLRVWRDGVWVNYATSPTVTVTDPGWTGSFTSAQTVAGEYEFLGVTSALFTWDQPLQYAWVAVVDEQGTVIGTCTATGLLDCSAALALEPGDSQGVHAEARVNGVGGGHVTIATSASVQLTGMNPDEYASFILYAPPAALPPLLGDARAAKAIEVRSKQLTVNYCLVLGQRHPTYRLNSTVPDLTLLCSAGAIGLLAWMIVDMGVDLALDLLATTDDDEPEPEPGEPEPDPGTGGSGSGGDDDGDDGDPSDICRVTGPDGQEFVLKEYDFHSHIVDVHTGEVDSQKSKWGTNQDPIDDADLGEFICQSLRAPRYGDDPGTNGNRAYRYDSGGPYVGSLAESRGGALTTQYTVVVRPDGTVATAYPGW